MPLIVRGFDDLDKYDEGQPSPHEDEADPCWICDKLNNVYVQMGIVSVVTIASVLIFNRSVLDHGSTIKSLILRSKKKV